MLPRFYPGAQGKLNNLSRFTLEVVAKQMLDSRVPVQYSWLLDLDTAVTDVTKSIQFAVSLHLVFTDIMGIVPPQPSVGTHLCFHSQVSPSPTHGSFP